MLLLEAGGEQTSKLRVPWFHLWLLSTPHSWNQVTDSQTWAMKGLENQVRAYGFINNNHHINII